MNLSLTDLEPDDITVLIEALATYEKVQRHAEIDCGVRTADAANRRWRYNRAETLRSRLRSVRSGL